MKRILAIVILALAAGLFTGAEAQQREKTNKLSAVRKKGLSKIPARKKEASQAQAVTLTSAGTNAAYGSAAARRFSIADPVVRGLNQQAAGGLPQVSSSGIVGMPKRTYGFANGKILLRNTTATTPGTVYGSGSVGTGTTIMGVGTGENTIGVNGKSPDAGPWLWGSKLPGRNLPATDSAQRKQ